MNATRPLLEIKGLHKSFGAVEVERQHYSRLLGAALEVPARFDALDMEHPVPGAVALSWINAADGAFDRRDHRSA